MTHLLLLMLTLWCTPIADWDKYGFNWGGDVVQATPVYHESDTEQVNVWAVEWESTMPICRVDVEAGVTTFVNGYQTIQTDIYSGTASPPQDWNLPVSGVTWYAEQYRLSLPIMTKEVNNE